MKIEFTNADMTEATLTVGRWWWKRVTQVQRADEPHIYTVKDERHGQKSMWLFTGARIWCNPPLSSELEVKREWQRIWRRPGTLTRVVK